MLKEELTIFSYRVTYGGMIFISVFHALGIS